MTWDIRDIERQRRATDAQGADAIKKLGVPLPAPGAPEASLPSGPGLTTPGTVFSWGSNDPDGQEDTPWPQAWDHELRAHGLRPGHEWDAYARLLRRGVQEELGPPHDPWTDEEDP